MTDRENRSGVDIDERYFEDVEMEGNRCSRTEKRFTVNKDEYEASKININDTLLSYLRQNGQTDVKQMCEEGGCGACSVIEMVNTGSKTGSRAVSSCLVPLAQEGFKKYCDLIRKKGGNFEMIKV